LYESKEFPTLIKADFSSEEIAEVLDLGAAGIVLQASDRNAQELATSFREMVSIDS